MKKPKVCVLRTAGTNCDKETAFAFAKAGASPELVHINSIIRGKASLDKYQILALPGGFSYGDDVSAGKILANELRFKLADGLRRFIQAGKLIIGICNGFQILVKSGMLPGNKELRQETSLIINDSGKFEDRWVYLRTKTQELRANKCIWTNNLEQIIYLPIAHGEGKFVTLDKKTLEGLRKNEQIVFQYCDERGKLLGYPYNPNGSVDSIAGICDETGRIFGLMPHPERHIETSQHPRWAALKNKKEGLPDEQAGDGMQILRNGVDYARKNL